MKNNIKDFIDKSNNIHGNEYDYSKVEYKGSREKVTIICKKHGDFLQQYHSHLNGNGCPKCSIERTSKSRSYTNEIFLDKSNKVHGGKYDYSKVEYSNSQTKVIIICPSHGEFTQIPNAHISGQGCPKCSFERNSKRSKYTTDIFKEKSKIKHGDKYDYSMVEYINSKTKVKIICPSHGEFLQNPNSHLIGCGCPKCAYLISNCAKPLSYFIDKANNVHNFKYDYSLILNYKNSEEKVKIKCKEGHVFGQTMRDHVNGNGCPRCSKKCFDTESFIRLSNEVHGGKYDYSKTIYETQKTIAIIICPQHGEFKQKATNHYHLKRGCPRCSENKGEREIRKWLNINKIKFIKEHTFDSCGDKNKLRFDFYLPKYNTCIEFDGAQHFKPIERFGGKDYFEDIRYKDNIKNEFCLNENIKLIRISYKEIDKVYSILSEKLLHL